MSSNFLNSGVYVEEETVPLNHIHRNQLVLPIEENKSQSAFFLRRLHIINWIRTYNRDMAAADLVAGVTLGMTIIPQSIAYASLAGLSSQYGLYSAFVGSFVYVLFGTIPQVSIGPTSLMALLTLQFTMNFPVEFAIVLAFLSGLIEMAMGILNLGFVVNFISRPVNSAFTTATSIIVILVQLKGLLGINNKYQSTNYSNFFNQFSVGDSLLGSLCLATLLCLRQLNNIKFQDSSSLKKLIRHCFWYISISRNAIVIFCASLVAYKMVVLDGRSNIPFALSKKVNSTALSISLPPLTIIHNGTTYSFSDICNVLGGGIFVVPFIAVLANIAIAKAFAQGTRLDASQEMLTLGLCNIVGSFFSSMPTCGAFTRSAVSQASGVRTPMAGVYTSSIVLLAIGVLTPYFEFIPKAALSAVLIIAVLFMVDFKILKNIWTASKRDFFCWIVVFTLCIWSGVELGLIFGIILNMVFIALRLANPNIEADIKELNGHYFIHVVPGADIYYTGAENLRNKINIMCTDCNYIYPVVIDCGKIMQFDFTLTETLGNILKELKEKNVSTYLQSINCKDQGILSDLKMKTLTCRDLEELKSFSLENK